MRIALISALVGERAGDGLALMPLAGRSLARRQLDVALALGCERIACFADGPAAGIVELQHAAERAGAKFNAISNSRALVGLVRAADELLVLAPGVLPDAGLVAQALADRPGVLVLAAERAVEAGFERIDREHAWAGILMAQGDIVERLFELPPDSDPISSLLRIALQRGSRRIPLPEKLRDTGELVLVADADSLASAEQRWLARAMGEESWWRPATTLVGRIVRRFAPRALAWRGSSSAADALAVLLTAGGVALAALEHLGAGVAALGLAAAAFHTGQLLRRFERGSARRPWLNGRAIGEWLVDTAFLIAAIAGTPRDPREAAFAGLVLILAMRLVRQAGAGSRIAPAGDRIVVLAMLALAAAFGVFMPVVQGVALMTLILALTEAMGARLTRA